MSKIKLFIFGCGMILLEIIGYTEINGADWKFLLANDEGEFFYDTENITHSRANTNGIWLKIVYSEEYKEKERLDSISHTIGLWELDCGDKRVCLLSMSHYDKGEEMSAPSIFLPPEWKSIAPRTILDSLYNKLCK